MEHRIEHDLSPELARKTVQRAVDTYSQKFAGYNVQSHWPNQDQVDIGFNAKGVKLSGQVKLVPNALLIDMDVPLLLRPFRKKALDVIEIQVKAWIEKAHAGQL